MSVFDNYAERYDEWYRRHPLIAESEVETVAQLLPPKGLGLEVGVGSGFFAHRLGVEYGLDPSIGMLRIAHQRGVEVVQGVGEKLPLRSSALDYVLVIVTLCFAENPLELLREARRVLRPSGRLVVCIVPADSSWGRHYIDKARRGHPLYSIARLYTIDEIVEMAHQAGFTPEDWRSTLHKPPSHGDYYEKPKRSLHGGFVCLRLRPRPAPAPGAAR